MNLYDSMIDDYGVMIDSRVCIFIKFVNIDRNGHFEQYQISKIITSDRSGLLLIIDEDNLGHLHQYKIIFENNVPKLVERSES